MDRADILTTATQYVTQDRQDQYGGMEDNFKIIADFWSTYLGARLNVAVDAEDVANMMALLKIARISTGQPKADNYIDLAGYAACAGEIATK
jgi:hypothetical protein